MHRVRVPFLLLPVLLVLAAPAARTPEAEETGPATVTVRRGPLGGAVTAKGVLVPTRVTTVTCEPKAYGGKLEIREAARGGPVVKGQVLVAFDDADLTKQIAERKTALALARNKLARLEQDEAFKDRENALAMEAAVRAKREADDDLARFVTIERKLREAEAELRLEGSKDRLQEQQEELEQLVKMYESDDLTEETEEIVLRRAKRGLERSLRSFEFQRQRHEWFMTLTLPQDLEKLHVAVRKTAVALERLKATQPLDDEKRALDLVKTRAEVREQEETLADLDADRAALTVKAPFAGDAVVGVFKNGKWSGLDGATPSLEPGTRVKAGQALFTVLDGGALVVETAVKEADLGRVKAGLPAGVTTALTGASPLEAEVASVARYGADGSYRVEVRLRALAEQLRAGLACGVRIHAAEGEEVLSLPVACLGKDGEQEVVWVVGADGPNPVPVETGRRDGGRVEIVQGLDAGQRVLASPPEAKAK